MVSLDFCISVVKAGKEMEGIKQKKKKKMAKKECKKCLPYYHRNFVFD